MCFSTNDRAPAACVFGVVRRTLQVTVRLPFFLRFVLISGPRNTIPLGHARIEPAAFDPRATPGHRGFPEGSLGSRILPSGSGPWGLTALKSQPQEQIANFQIDGLEVTKWALWLAMSLRQPKPLIRLILTRDRRHMSEGKNA